MIKLLCLPVFMCYTTFGLSQNMRILNAFKQSAKSGTGNCTSVATIKAAIDLYGVGNVFQGCLSNAAKKYFVVLRTGKELTLTFAELDQAIKAARFVENVEPTARPIKMYADTCFAVMCKYLQLYPDLQPVKKYVIFDEAIDDLNDGFDTPSAAMLLGLKVNRIHSDLQSIHSRSSVIMYNVYHAVYVSNGVYDEAGDSDGIADVEKFKCKRAGLKCGFLFCGPSGAMTIDGRDEFSLR